VVFQASDLYHEWLDPEIFAFGDQSSEKDRVSGGDTKLTWPKLCCLDVRSIDDKLVSQRIKCRRRFESSDI